MALNVNLGKATESLKLSLKKAGVLTPPQLEVGFAMDVSGSFEDEHESGVTNDLMTRLIPWGLAFDPDQKVDCFTFSDGAGGVDDVGPINANNYEGFVHKKIIRKVKGWNGATDYSYVLERMLTHFGWLGEVKKAGFLGGLFGKKDQIVQGQKRRSLAIIITDGDNADKNRTMEVLRASQARQDQVYFLFLGVSNQNARFPFLEKVGDHFDNTGFVAISNLSQFVQLSDEEINAKLINQELINWLKG